MTIPELSGDGAVDRVVLRSWCLARAIGACASEYPTPDALIATARAFESYITDTDKGEGNPDD